MEDGAVRQNFERGTSNNPSGPLLSKIGPVFLVCLFDGV
jgi:hypothetical protein